MAIQLRYEQLALGQEIDSCGQNANREQGSLHQWRPFLSFDRRHLRAVYRSLYQFPLLHRLTKRPSLIKQNSLFEIDCITHI